MVHPASSGPLSATSHQPTPTPLPSGSPATVEPATQSRGSDQPTDNAGHTHAPDELGSGKHRTVVLAIVASTLAGVLVACVIATVAVICIAVHCYSHHRRKRQILVEESRERRAPLLQRTYSFSLINHVSVVLGNPAYSSKEVNI